MSWLIPQFCLPNTLFLFVISDQIVLADSSRFCLGIRLVLALLGIICVGSHGTNFVHIIMETLLILQAVGSPHGCSHSVHDRSNNENMDESDDDDYNESDGDDDGSFEGNGDDDPELEGEDDDGNEAVGGDR